MQSKRVYEIGRFCLVGGISFLIDYGLLYGCTEWLHLYYLYSSALAFTVSVIINYLLCLEFVFPGAGKQSSGQMILFAGSSVVGLFLNQLFMWLFVDKCGIYYMISKIFATILVMIWNYFMKRKAVLGN